MLFGDCIIIDVHHYRRRGLTIIGGGVNFSVASAPLYYYDILYCGVVEEKTLNVIVVVAYFLGFSVGETNSTTRFVDIASFVLYGIIWPCARDSRLIKYTIYIHF